MLFIKFSETGGIKTYSTKEKPFHIKATESELPKGLKNKPYQFEICVDENTGDLLGVKKRSEEEISILEAEREMQAEKFNNEFFN